MPVSMLYDPDVPNLLGRNGTCPIVVCEACNQRIVLAEDGRFLISRGGGERERLPDILFVHRGACQDRVEQNAGILGGERLQVFLSQLALSLGL